MEDESALGERARWCKALWNECDVEVVRRDQQVQTDMAKEHYRRWRTGLTLAFGWGPKMSPSNVAGWPSVVAAGPQQQKSAQIHGPPPQVQATPPIRLWGKQEDMGAKRRREEEPLR